MIRYADRGVRKPMPSIALVGSGRIKESTRAELAAKASGQVMEIMGEGRPLCRICQQPMPEGKGYQHASCGLMGTETGRMRSDRPNIMELAEKNREARFREEPLEAQAPYSPCQIVSDYRALAEENEGKVEASEELQQCPECLREVDKDELETFNGLCEECANE